MGVAVVIGLFLLTGSVAGAEIHQLEVRNRGEVYKVELAFRVGTRADAVFKALTDYANLKKLHPGIVESEVLRGPPGLPLRVRTVLRGCIAFFCRDLERVQMVTAQGGFAIRTRIVPEESDFREGESAWELRPVRGGTEVRLRSRMIPELEVPPVLGPWAIKHSLERNLRDLIQHLERLGDSGDKG